MKLEASFDLSRDPSDYETSAHLLQRLRKGGERKVIDFEMVAEAIEEGDIKDVEGDDVILRHQWLMTTFEVVIAPKDTKIKTAYEIES